ncbi:MAG: 30S ribosomal protein S6 [Mariprofundales bacterium]
MYYETVLIVSPDVSQENAKKLRDEMISKVEASQARVVRHEYWGMRQLAYSIAKRRRAHYFMLVIDGHGEAVNALEHALRLHERVLRFLTVQLDELSDTPSPLARRERKEKEAEPQAASDDDVVVSAEAEKTDQVVEADKTVKDVEVVTSEKDTEKAVVTKDIATDKIAAPAKTEAVTDA